MEISKSLSRFLVVVGGVLGLVSSSWAYDFYVGGRDGWVSNPSESYSSWAGRNRFQINDTLVFKYSKGADSVLVVTKQDYDACNVSNPIQKLEGGDSVYKLDRSGPFFFISGVQENCRKGQKLLVVVLADRSKKPSPSPLSPPPAIPPSSLFPPSKPPTSSPPASSPSHSPTPSSSASPSPSPSILSPSPSLSPASTAHAPSPSPTSLAPSPAPGPWAHSPVSIPSQSPSPSLGTSPPSTISTPAEPPTESPPPPPISSDEPPSNTPSTSPPSPSSSSVVSASRMTLGLVAMILGGVFLH